MKWAPPPSHAHIQPPSLQYYLPPPPPPLWWLQSCSNRLLFGYWLYLQYKTTSFLCLRSVYNLSADRLSLTYVHSQGGKLSDNSQTLNTCSDVAVKSEVLALWQTAFGWLSTVTICHHQSVFNARSQYTSTSDQRIFFIICLKLRKMFCLVKFYKLCSLLKCQEICILVSSAGPMDVFVAGRKLAPSITSWPSF